MPPRRSQWRQARQREFHSYGSMLHRGVGRGVGVNRAIRRAHLQCSTEPAPTKGTRWVELTIKSAWTYGRLLLRQSYGGQMQKATKVANATHQMTTTRGSPPRATESSETAVQNSPEPRTTRPQSEAPRGSRPCSIRQRARSSSPAELLDRRTPPPRACVRRR